MNFLFINVSLRKSIMITTQRYKEAKTTLITTRRNVSWAANQDIIMISEGSCDTEDWSIDAENTALITGKQLF